MNSDSDTESPTGASAPLAAKVVLVGDGTAGKTCLSVQCARSEFDGSYKQTLGVDFLVKRLTIGAQGPKHVTVKIWDIGGQTIGGRMLPNYLVDTNVVLFVYDMTNAESFRNLEQWATAITDILHEQREAEKKGTDEDAASGVRRTKKKPTAFALIGNKSDLEFRRVVSEEEHQRFLKTFKMSGFFVSAKTGDNVDQMFKTMVAGALGIRINKRDLEAGATNQSGVVAPILAPASTRSPLDSAAAPAKRRQAKSSVCSIQ